MVKINDIVEVELDDYFSKPTQTYKRIGRVTKILDDAVFVEIRGDFINGNSGNITIEQDILYEKHLPIHKVRVIKEAV